MGSSMDQQPGDNQAGHLGSPASHPLASTKQLMATIALTPKAVRARFAHGTRYEANVGADGCAILSLLQEEANAAGPQQPPPPQQEKSTINKVGSAAIATSRDLVENGGVFTQGGYAALALLTLLSSY
eukprot:SAG31_NODE_2361_length_5869_cov_3.154246_5_plen_128_part_00